MCRMLLNAEQVLLEELSAALAIVEGFAGQEHLYHCRHVMGGVLALSTRCVDPGASSRALALARGGAEDPSLSSSERMLFASACYKIADLGLWRSTQRPGGVAGVGLERPPLDDGG